MYAFNLRLLSISNQSYFIIQLNNIVCTCNARFALFFNNLFFARLALHLCCQRTLSKWCCESSNVSLMQRLNSLLLLFTFSLALFSCVHFNILYNNVTKCYNIGQRDQKLKRQRSNLPKCRNDRLHRKTVQGARPRRPTTNRTASNGTRTQRRTKYQVKLKGGFFELQGPPPTELQATEPIGAATN